MNAPARIETGTVTTEGLIVISEAIREAAGLLPGQPYEVSLDDAGRVVLKPLGDGSSLVENRRKAQSKAIEAIAGRFDFGGTTDEVMRRLRGDYHP